MIAWGRIGYHPWFTHWISLSPGTPLSKEEHYRALFLTGSGSTSHTDDRQDGQLAAFEKLLPSLPEPTSLADLLSNLRSNLEAFPTAMLGEVGLDRTCRIPFDYNASPRMLSPFMIPFEHQLAVFEAQVQLAVELQRNVSFHSVNARKATIDVLARMKERHGPAWSRISVDMHSCGLSVEMWREIEVQKRSLRSYIHLVKPFLILEITLECLSFPVDSHQRALTRTQITHSRRIATPPARRVRYQSGRSMCKPDMGHAVYRRGGPRVGRRTELGGGSARESVGCGEEVRKKLEILCQRWACAGGESEGEQTCAENEPER